MKSSQISFLVFILLCSGSLKAQYESILNDPDVIWAAEIDLTFWIEPEYMIPDSVFASSCSSTLLKLRNRAAIPGDESEVLFASRLLSILLDEKKKVYAHPDSLRPLSFFERDQILNVKDTVTVFDPETYAETNRVVYNCWSAESIQLMRVRQLLFYRDKTDEFELYTLAFAPVLRRNYGSVGHESYFWYTPFWYKMPPYRRKETQRPFMDDPNISLARRMRTGDNMPALKSLKPFKDFKQPVMQQYLNRLSQDASFQVREGMDWEVMPQKDRMEEIICRDSVVTFDPETYEEKMIVIENSMNGWKIMDLRLVQDWLWDDRQKYPVFQLYAFAPMEQMRDDEGNPRFKRPVFWRLIKD